MGANETIVSLACQIAKLKQWGSARPWASCCRDLNTVSVHGSVGVNGLGKGDNARSNGEQIIVIPHLTDRGGSHRLPPGQDKKGPTARTVGPLLKLAIEPEDDASNTNRHHYRQQRRAFWS